MYLPQITTKDLRSATIRSGEWLSSTRVRQPRTRAAWIEGETTKLDMVDMHLGLRPTSIIPSRKGRKCKSHDHSWESVPRPDGPAVHHLCLKPCRAHKHSQSCPVETPISRTNSDACSRVWAVV